jgi:hypothetical protein
MAVTRRSLARRHNSCSNGIHALPWCTRCAGADPCSRMLKRLNHLLVFSLDRATAISASAPKPAITRGRCRLAIVVRVRRVSPRHSTPRHSTPRHSTPRHSTARHSAAGTGFEESLLRREFSGDGVSNLCLRIGYAQSEYEEAHPKCAVSIHQIFSRMSGVVGSLRLPLCANRFNVEPQQSIAVPISTSQDHRVCTRHAKRARWVEWFETTPVSLSIFIGMSHRHARCVGCSVHRCRPETARSVSWS